MLATNTKKRVEDRLTRLSIVLLTFCFCSASSFIDLSAIAGNISTGDELLFQRSLSVNRSVNIFDTDTFDLDLRLGNQFFNPTNPILLFDDLSITPADVGTTFEATVANDAAFLTAIDRLTDPQDEFIAVLFTEDQPSGLQEQRGWSELFFFLSSPTSFSEISSASIRSITLTVDQFNLVPAGTPVSSPGPPVDLMLTLSIFAVPEPTSVWLLMMGLVTLSTVRRR